MSKIPYTSAIGSIMYVMLCTRPNVSYALSMTSRYQQDPGEGHWTAAKNILKYLRRTKYIFLVYGGLEDELCVTASDAAKEAFWISKFINELAVVPTILNPIDLFCDNSGTIVQTKEPRSHQWTNHIRSVVFMQRNVNGQDGICPSHL
ncbi:hypothetical protein K1719_002079 [Acacia pycnantha]|nr:hypothetical protein K1719_002079 [Acacia pycnantha]